MKDLFIRNDMVLMVSLLYLVVEENSFCLVFIVSYMIYNEFYYKGCC